MLAGCVGSVSREEPGGTGSADDAGFSDLTPNARTAGVDARQSNDAGYSTAPGLDATDSDGTSPHSGTDGPEPSRGGSDAGRLDGDAGRSDAGAGTGGDADYLQKVVPVLLITVGKSLVKDTKLEGRLRVIEDHDGTLVGIENQAATQDLKVGIELRGTSSGGFAQYPMGFEIRDDAGSARSVSLLGLPPESDFVLHSPYADKTSMRNVLTYAIGREVAAVAGRYGAPRTRWVEVYKDGSYRGLYVLVEKIKVDKFRVSMPKAAPDVAKGDITGGYIWSAEGSTAEVRPAAKIFLDVMNTGRQWQYRFPSYSSISPAQKSYLQTAVATMQKKIAANPTWDEAKKVMDAGSVVDQAIINEVTKNTDGFFKSWYFYKQPDALGGKYFMGPIWDYDIAWGNVNWKKRYCSNLFLSEKAFDGVAPFTTMGADPAFRNEARCRYNELRKAGGPLDVARVEAKIDSYAKHIGGAKLRDQKKWTNIGRYVWPSNYVGPTWADDVRYLKYWIRRRLAWLDANMYGTCSSVPMPSAPTQISAPAPISETAPRTGICCNGANVYIPIAGPAPAGYSDFACPM